MLSHTLHERCCIIQTAAVIAAYPVKTIRITGDEIRAFGAVERYEKSHIPKHRQRFTADSTERIGKHDRHKACIHLELRLEKTDIAPYRHAVAVKWFSLIA